METSCFGHFIGGENSWIFFTRVVICASRVIVSRWYFDKLSTSLRWFFRRFSQNGCKDAESGFKICDYLRFLSAFICEKQYQFTHLHIFKSSNLQICTFSTASPFQSHIAPTWGFPAELRDPSGKSSYKTRMPLKPGSFTSYQSSFWCMAMVFIGFNKVIRFRAWWMMSLATKVFCLLGRKIFRPYNLLFFPRRDARPCVSTRGAIACLCFF